MKEIKELIKELKEKLRKETEFNYWEFLNKLENISFQENKSIVKGKIEENVIIKGLLFLGKNSIIKSGSRIEGNAFIGDNTVIGPNAYLRKNVVIADNCLISNSEIKNSIILSGSKVPHFSYVGDSIISENCNLGAGTKLANLRFDNKTVNVSVKGKKIDSKRRKLGSLLHSNVKTGINSGINCGLILGKNSKVFPGKTLSKNLKENEECK